MKFTVNKNENDIILNSASVKSILGINSDVVFREIYIDNNPKFPVTLVFVEGLVDHKIINDNILKPLVQGDKLGEAKNYKEIIQLIEHGAIYTSTIKIREKIGDLINDILSGFSALIFDAEKKGITFETRGFEKRNVSEPTAENVIKGAKDSFIEDLRSNTAVIRRKIKSPNLVIEETTIGKHSKTSVAIIYIKGITNEKIVDELRKRLNNIEIDGVPTINFIAEYIVDNKYTPFPLIDYTERTDKFCADIIEGRAGIIIDSIPISLIVPAELNKFLQSPEDYSHSWIVGSLKRFLRYVLLLISLTFPAFYISLTTFNQEMLPRKLGFSISVAREGVPFPSYVEVILMNIAFEILYEAGLRLPKVIGQTTSIVGALIVGEAAVNARIVSAPVVIIVAVTVISSFTMPSQDLTEAIRVLRLLLIILSSILGLYGLTIGFLLILYHLCTIESFGVPYLSPFVGNENKDLKDALFRLPIIWLRNRPTFLKPLDKKRQK